MESHFKSIQSQWYKKLKDSGFEDIEVSNGQIIRWHGAYFIEKYTPESFEIKQSYYRRASYFLENYGFEKEDEYQIWKLHSDGISLREISKITAIKTCQIFLIVKDLKQKMLELC